MGLAVARWRAVGAGRDNRNARYDVAFCTRAIRWLSRRSFCCRTPEQG